jgi:hypothetical protein
MRVAQNEKSARLAKGRASSDKAAHRSIQATALSNVGKGDERIMAGHHSPPIASARF